jgi:hypothetical protein
MLLYFNASEAHMIPRPIREKMDMRNSGSTESHWMKKTTCTEGTRRTQINSVRTDWMMVITLDTSPLTRSNVKKDLELRYSCSIVPWTVSDTMESTTEMKELLAMSQIMNEQINAHVLTSGFPRRRTWESNTMSTAQKRILNSVLNLYLKVNLMDLTNSAFKSPQKYIMMNQFK